MNSKRMKEYKGLLVKGIGGFYYVKTSEGEIIECKAKGLFKKKSIVPTVGDFVKIKEGENNHFTITEIDERKNIFVRPPVSNVDVMIIVVSEVDPKVNFEVLDKFLIMSEKNAITPIICINKVELIEKESSIEAVYKELYPVIKVSAINEQGLQQLKDVLPTGNVVLAGPSGVGKSTILNKLIGEENAEVGAISKKMKRGKHTTRHVEIFELEAGQNLFDTPGFTSFELKGIEPNELQDLFIEIEKNKSSCRYSDCKHLVEPGCEIIGLQEDGKISQSRYENYKKIYEQLRIGAKQF